MAAARYAAQQGAIVRVTDMKAPEVLAPSVKALTGLPIEFRPVARIATKIFYGPRMVIRNPGVPLFFPLSATGSVSMGPVSRWRLASSFSLVQDALSA